MPPLLGPRAQVGLCLGPIRPNRVGRYRSTAVGPTGGRSRRLDEVLAPCRRGAASREPSLLTWPGDTSTGSDQRLRRDATRPPPAQPRPVAQRSAVPGSNTSQARRARRPPRVGRTYLTEVTLGATTPPSDDTWPLLAPALLQNEVRHLGEGRRRYACATRLTRGHHDLGPTIETREPPLDAEPRVDHDPRTVHRLELRVHHAVLSSTTLCNGRRSQRTCFTKSHLAAVAAFTAVDASSNMLKYYIKCSGSPARCQLRPVMTRPVPSSRRALSRSSSPCAADGLTTTCGCNDIRAPRGHRVAPRWPRRVRASRTERSRERIRASRLRWSRGRTRAHAPSTTLVPAGPEDVPANARLRSRCHAGGIATRLARTRARRLPTPRRERRCGVCARAQRRRTTDRTSAACRRSRVSPPGTIQRSGLAARVLMDACCSSGFVLARAARVRRERRHGPYELSIEGLVARV